MEEILKEVFMTILNVAMNYKRSVDNTRAVFSKPVDFPPCVMALGQALEKYNSLLKASKTRKPQHLNPSLALLTRK